MVVKERANGEPIVLGDVAKLLIDHQPLGGDAVINNGPGLLLVVEKFPWGNTLEVTRGVEAAIDEMRPGLPGIEFDTQVFRAGNFVDDAIQNLSHSLLVGVLLMMLVLVVFLYDWRSALDQRRDDPALADRGGARAPPARRHDQHDDPGGVRDRLGGGRRRCDRRLREHRAAPADPPEGERRPIRPHDGEDHLRCVARGARRGGVRVDDRGVGAAADLLPAGPDRLLLPPAGRGIRPGGRRVHVGRADLDPGDGDAPAAQGTARAPRVAAGRMAAARLRSAAGADHPQPRAGVRHRGRAHGGGCGHAAAAWAKPSSRRSRSGTS